MQASHMTDPTDVVDDYIAVWNEPNADERRRRIRSLWAPDGTTCHRLLDAHGYEAIEARVTGAWDKWLREGKYIFHLKNAVCHHDVVKCDWVMVTVPGDEVEATGLSFLVLNPDGRIAHDYQFNPTADDAGDLAERYVAVWNEPDAAARRRRIAELWAPDGSHVTETLASKGHGAIEAEALKAFDARVAKRCEFSPANGSQAHHNVARLTWRIRAKDSGKVGAAGCNLLILDDGGRIRFDYQYDDRV
jgi:hypothetical protein